MRHRLQKIITETNSRLVHPALIQISLPFDTTFFALIWIEYEDPALGRCIVLVIFKPFGQASA